MEGNNVSAGIAQANLSSFPRYDNVNEDQVTRTQQSSGVKQMFFPGFRKNQSISGDA